MVSKPTIDQQLEDVQNAESCTAWIVAKCRAEKKDDKINTGTVSDLQVTNIFLSMCRRDALLKNKSITSPKGHLDTPFEEIRVVIETIFLPKGEL